MKNKYLILLSGAALAASSLLVSITIYAQDKEAKPRPPMTVQAKRGHELYLHSPKGIACANCHQVDNEGTAVGPNLKDLASIIGPHGLAGTIQMSMTAYVQEVKTTAGVTFPGILKAKDGDNIQMWDLSKTPPVLVTLGSKEVKSMKQNEKWKHPPTVADYSDQELADIVAFLKWASVGATAEIKPSDL
jgi:putative heme-binding domain-containing protein